MNIAKQRTFIRSLGVSKINRLVRAAADFDQLKSAFEEWAEGEIYVCKKTGSYRYRYGDLSKSETAWSATALRLFATPAEFAFAAMLFANPRPQERPARVPATRVPAPSATRVNVLSIAREVAA